MTAERIDWDAFPGVDRLLLQFKHGRTPVPGEARGAVLYVKGRSFTDVSRLLNAHFGTERFTKDAVQKRYATLLPPVVLSDYPAPQPTPYLDAHFDESGKPRAPFSEEQKAGRMLRRLLELEMSGHIVKTLVLSDQQGVFSDWDLITRATEDHIDADIIVCPGDVADWESASKYVHERDYPLRLEADWVVRHYQALSERYPESVIVVTGSNHRRRVENAVRQLPSGLLFLAEHNPERYLAQPFHNIVSVGPWWLQIGDVVYAHKEGRTAEAGDNARAAIQTFRNWRDSRQFAVNDFRVVVTGHSHKLAEVTEHGVKGIEPGTLAKLPMPYMQGAGTTATQTNGYAYVTQRNGSTKGLLNHCRAVTLESEDAADE